MLKVDMFTMTYSTIRCLTFCVLVASTLTYRLAVAQNLDELRYDEGAPSVVDYYIDPVNGRDTNNGLTPAGAFKTLTRGWNAIPTNTTLTAGYQFNILPGTLPESALPNYLESKHGTFKRADSNSSSEWSRHCNLGGDLNVFDTHYLYIKDVIINPQPAGDAFHCEQCDHILIKNSELSGGNRQAHETIKVNQSQHIYIEDSNIPGGGQQYRFRRGSIWARSPKSHSRCGRLV